MLRNCKQILAIAIISAGVSGAAIIPNIISAQSSIPKTAAVVTAQNQKSEQNPFNLTDAQKQQFKTLNEKTSKLIQDVLTPEQQATFTAELKKSDRSAAWKAIKLSREQKKRITEINKSDNEKKLTILTAEQRSQLAKRSVSVSQ
jgi:Spy/CpxP family protein refolding chaperone